MSDPRPGREYISSLQNGRVKGVVKLRTRRERERRSAFLVEGHRELSRALAWRAHLQMVFCCPSLFSTGMEDGLLSDLEGSVEIVEVSAPVFRKVSYRDQPEGLLAVLRQPSLRLGDLGLGLFPLVLVVEAVEKPGNLGAMLRTAEAAGVDAVIVTDPATDVFNPNVVRASLGSLFTLPLAVSSGHRAQRWLREHHVEVIATGPEADRSCWEVDLRGGVALVIGSEQAGLSDLWMSGADQQVRIPMSGSVDSLNAGSAAAVMLFEARRQRSSA